MPGGSALVKNVRAAVRSRLADSQTSMTCPYWSTGRYGAPPSYPKPTTSQGSHAFHSYRYRSPLCCEVTFGGEW